MLKFGGQLPVYFAELAENADYLAAAKAAGKAYAKLLAAAEAAIAQRQLQADKLVAAIFAKSDVIPVTGDLMTNASVRMRRGNPPGKKQGSGLGDELNYESLLSAVPSHVTLHIVSNDGDYASDLDEGLIDPFIASEWNKKKTGELKLYRSLAAFFAKHYPDIKLATEIAKALAISQLAKSGSFVSTHIAIAALSKHLGSFTPAEADQIAEIVQQNGQVSMIAGDTDVADFLRALKKTKDIGADTIMKIDAALPSDDDGLIVVEADT
jgi:hypothetical protein